MRRRSLGPVVVIAICAALSGDAIAQDTATAPDPEPPPPARTTPPKKKKPPATQQVPEASQTGDANEPATETEATDEGSATEQTEQDADWPPPSHPTPPESDEQQTPEYPPGYGPYYGPPPDYGVAPPRPPPEPKGPMRRNNTGMMVAGIVLTSLGAVGLATGVALADAADPEDTRANCVSGPCGNDEPLDVRKRNAAIIVATGGLALVGVGIPLLVVGARQVPADEDGETAGATAVPQLAIGPAGGRLTWTF